jgi:hypothetical protein
VAEDRTYTAWKALIDAQRKALGAGVRYLVSNRAKALIQPAAPGVEGLRMPDFFHVLHALGKSYALAIGRRLHQARKQLEAAEHAAISAPWRTWARELLLPWVYGEHHVAHTRCARRKAKIRQACEVGRIALHTPAFTLRLPAQALAA